MAEPCLTAVNFKTKKSTVLHSLQKFYKSYCERRKVTFTCFFLLTINAKRNKQDDRSREQDKKRNKPDGMGIYLYILKLFPNYEKRKIKMFSFAL